MTHSNSRLAGCNCEQMTVETNIVSYKLLVAISVNVVVMYEVSLILVILQIKKVNDI